MQVEIILGIISIIILSSLIVLNCSIILIHLESNTRRISLACCFPKVDSVFMFDFFFNNYAPINVKPAGGGGGGGGGGRAWGGDLIVFVVPGVGHLTDLFSRGRGYLTADSDDSADSASTLHACAHGLENLENHGGH